MKVKPIELHFFRSSKHEASQIINNSTVMRVYRNQLHVRQDNGAVKYLFIVETKDANKNIWYPTNKTLLYSLLDRVE